MASSHVDIPQKTFLMPKTMLLYVGVFFLSCQLVRTSNVQSVQSYMDILEGSPFPESLMPKDQLVGNIEEDQKEIERDSDDFTGFLATSGRLFSYRLPEEFLGDDVFNLKVFEAGHDSLPDWLGFDEMFREFVGVPSEEHIGNTHSIQVTAGNVSQPVPGHAFTLKVVEDNVHLDNKQKSSNLNVDKTKEGAIRCPHGSSVTSASVTVDINMDTLAPKELGKIMTSLASHLDMPADWLKLVPVGNRPLFDSSALVSGQGDVKDIQNPGAFVQWVVGCGNVQGHHMPILQQLEMTSGDGTMSQALGHGVVGWHVTNSRPESSNRMKRNTRERNKSRHNRRNKKKNSRRRNKNKQELVAGSGFTSIEVEEDTPETPTVKLTDTPMTKPTTSETSPTRVIVTTTTALPEVTTKSSTMAEEVDSSTTTTTPPLPDVETSPSSTSTSTKTTTPTPEIPTEIEVEDVMVEKPVGTISVAVGSILEYRVPKNTFKDTDGGKTRKLKLKLLTSDKHSLSRDSWIWFDNETQTIYGMPLDYHVGESQYILMAVNSAGRVATDTITVKVTKTMSSEKATHEFSVKIDLDYDQFMADTRLRLDVLGKIAKAFGDPDMSKITVTSIKRGSVELAWRNNTMPTEGCPEEEIRHLLNNMLTPENTVKQSFLNDMHPYQVKGVGITPKGACDLRDKTAPNTSSSDKPIDKEVEKTPVGEKKSDDSDKFISTILPVILISIMIILALIIACCLYRKRRKGKLSDEDNSTFVTKGIPVIFAEELEDKPDPPTKPLILSKEKPPLPPPEYPKSASGGSPPSTPGSGNSEPLLDQYTDDRYARPPPVTGGTGSMGRRLPKTPTQQPGYRQPPPYTHVPP